MGMEEPLVDFSGERNPKAAHQCFNEALRKVDAETMARTKAEHLGYIWATEE
jgi:hypothetical protein